MGTLGGGSSHIGRNPESESSTTYFICRLSASAPQRHICNHMRLYDVRSLKDRPASLYWVSEGNEGRPLWQVMHVLEPRQHGDDIRALNTEHGVVLLG